MDQFAEYRLFVALVTSGSVSRAAAKLNIAPSGASRRLKALEARLGAELVRRTTRTLHLTEAGEQFYARCIAILEAVEEAEQEVGDATATLRGRLRIAAPGSFGLKHVVPAVVEFMQRHPDLVIDLDLNDRRVDLVATGTDLAIRIAELEDSNLVARRLAPVHHVVCASPEYLQQHDPIKNPSDLSAHQCLTFSNLKAPGQWIYFDHEGNRQTVRVPVRLEASAGEALCAAAITGLGVLCEPDFIVYQAVRSGELVPILTDYQWYKMAAYALYPKASFTPARVRLFVEFLIKRFEGIPDWQIASGRTASG